MMTGLYLVAIVVLLLFQYFMKGHPKNFPPGPRFNLPIVGNLPQLLWLETNDSIRRAYGDIIGLFYGPQRAVIVYDFEILQEMASSHHFANKVQYPLEHLMRGGPIGTGKHAMTGGMLQSNGQNWFEQRRFSLHALRDLGFGKRTTDDINMEEAVKLCDYLKTFNGKPVDVTFIFHMAAISALWQVVVGHSLDYGDENLLKLVQLIDISLRGSSDLGTLPFTNQFISQLGYKFKFAKQVASFDALLKLLAEVIEGHKETYQDDNLRDFVDHYLREMEKNFSDKTSSFHGALGERNLLNVLMDLFLAGSDTTGTTLHWAMVYLLNNPHVTTRIQNELDGVTGRYRIPEITDKENTPYTLATIHEIQRMASILPSMSHCAVRDSTICNGKYFIPKDTRIFFCYEGIMKDPVHFPNPEVFDPTRLIDGDGKFVPNPRVLPFGYGKRRCIGEPLAKTTLYLFLTAILSNFNIEKEFPLKNVSERRGVGRIVKADPFKMCFVQRK